MPPYRLHLPRRGDRGFTLIELLVVMMIIGVLAAIAVPAYVNQRQKAADASIKSDLLNVAQAVEVTYGDDESYPYTDQLMGGIGGRAWINDPTVITGPVAGSSTNDPRAKGRIPVTDQKVAAGNVIVYFHRAGHPWCLFGESKSASKANDGILWIVYNSGNGGLQSGDPTNWDQCT